MKKINIFLDDLRTPDMSHNIGKGLGESYSLESKWVIVRDYFQFIKIVTPFDDMFKVEFANGDSIKFKSLQDLEKIIIED